jgi:polyphosphate kinase
VETCFPVLDPELAARVFDEALGNYLDDNLNAWSLGEDGGYTRVPRAEGATPHSAQACLLAKLCG